VGNRELSPNTPDATTSVVGHLSIACPGDTLINALSAGSVVVLSGFEITNISQSGSSFFTYAATTEGPLTLSDNGDPSSLRGITPQLGPGESFSPPPAALLVPQLREWVQQHVTYHVRAVEDTTIADSCVTVISFEAPQSVLITSFTAKAVEFAVELTWDLRSDEQVKGFRIYRSSGEAEARESVHSGDVIPAEERTFVDKSVRSAHLYEYTLVVVLADNSEISSPAVKIKTEAYKLTLNQNHPNPFNPVTKITFVLPQRIHTNLSIYNVEGKLVRKLVDEVLDEGFKEYVWDGKDSRGTALSSGVYFYRLRAGKDILTKKMVLLK
jgi:hypothetical protein